MADAFNADFVAISAVLAGVKDIRDAVARAELARDQYDRATILFVDEVHRFNKAQQDAFLPYVERGVLTFIGATTENPSFEVNSALLSRASVYVLHPLSTPRRAMRSSVTRTVTGGGSSTSSSNSALPRARRTGRRSTSCSSRRRSREACGASTRAVRRSTTRSLR